MKKIILSFALLAIVLLFQQCTKNDTEAIISNEVDAVTAKFGGRIDLNNLANYQNQPRPVYINKDNARGVVVSDAKATLGRVLFYDKQLSFDNSTSCGSCHVQKFAFGDTAIASRGVAGGLTGRHSMRLVNARFANEAKFFWNERANTLEAQTTQPIKDHAEMGFSGQAGRPSITDLIAKLQAVDYYQELFQKAYGNTNVTEAKMQECLAQFIRSIQSFDSKYDAGRAQVGNDNANFPNFTAQENAGKNLWLTAPNFNAAGVRVGGGLGCNRCHNAPEFDIDPNTRNNGVIGVLSGAGIDVGNTRAPSLRDLTGPNGEPNTPMMHTAKFATLQQMIGHYGSITVAPGNNQIDPRLRPNGVGQQLNLTAAEVNATIAFIKTLSGTNVYSDAKWSNPF